MEFLLIFFGLPLATIALFVYDLVKLLKCPKDNAELRKRYRTRLIISSIIMVVIVGGICGLLAIFALAVQHM